MIVSPERDRLVRRLAQELAQAKQTEALFLRHPRYDSQQAGVAWVLESLGVEELLMLMAELGGRTYDS
jgi:hypothetical protein